jgi:hypothetical protein
LHREVSRLFALEDAADITAAQAKYVSVIQRRWVLSLMMKPQP